CILHARAIALTQGNTNGMMEYRGTTNGFHVACVGRKLRQRAQTRICCCWIFGPSMALDGSRTSMDVEAGKGKRPAADEVFQQQRVFASERRICALQGHNQISQTRRSNGREQN